MVDWGRNINGMETVPFKYFAHGKRRLGSECSQDAIAGETYPLPNFFWCLFTSFANAARIKPQSLAQEIYEVSHAEKCF